MNLLSITASFIFFLMASLQSHAAEINRRGAAEITANALSSRQAPSSAGVLTQTPTTRLSCKPSNCPVFSCLPCPPGSHIDTQPQDCSCPTCECRPEPTPTPKANVNPRPQQTCPPASCPVPSCLPCPAGFHIDMQPEDCSCPTCQCRPGPTPKSKPTVTTPRPGPTCPPPSCPQPSCLPCPKGSYIVTQPEDCSCPVCECRVGTDPTTTSCAPGFPTPSCLPCPAGSQRVVSKSGCPTCECEPTGGIAPGTPKPALPTDAPSAALQTSEQSGSDVGATGQGNASTGQHTHSKIIPMAVTSLILFISQTL